MKKQTTQVQVRPHTASWVQVYLVRMNNHEKNRHVGIAHLFKVVKSGSSYREKKTHELSNMQDSKSVYWYAFTAVKFPSTSHAARIKSKGG